MKDQNKPMIFSEDSIVVGSLFFVTSKAIRNQTSLAKEALKDMMDHICFN